MNQVRTALTDRSSGNRFLLILLAVHVLFCLVGSWWVFTGNFDSGTIELMAVNIASGSDFPLFWYGQTYAGALEAYVAAGMILLFGSNELAMTMSPILFSTIWLAATYWLFKQLTDWVLGLIAATAALSSGYFVWYYSYALSGGYEIVLAFGTLILALAVWIVRRAPAGLQLLCTVVLIGILAALGIWVHFFIVPYLLVAFVLLLVHLYRRRNSWRPILGCYAVGAALSTIGLIPFYIANGGKVVGTGISTFVLTADHLRESIGMLLSRNLYRQLFFDIDAYPPFLRPWIHLLLLALLAAVAVYVILYCWQNRNKPGHGYLYVPMAFLLCFFFLFLPHRMSASNTPRYVNGAWAMIVSMAWCYAMGWRTRWRVLTPGLPILLFGLWIVHSGFVMYAFAMGTHPRKAEHLAQEQRIVQAVEQTGLRGAHLVGSRLFGFEGQRLSTVTGNRTAFVGVFDERFHSNAQIMEDEPNYGLIAQDGDREALAGSLASLSVTSKALDLQGVILHHDLNALELARRAVPAEEMAMKLAGQPKNAAAALSDRDFATVVRWAPKSGSEIRIDFAGSRNICGFWLLGTLHREEGTVVGLPKAYAVEAILEDGTTVAVKTIPHMFPEAYVHGGKVYVSGYHGLTESRFQPVLCQALVLHFPAEQELTLSEVVAFEQESGNGIRDPGDEAETIMDLLASEHADKVYADRWLSARLRALGGKGGVLTALPRFNPRHDSNQKGMSRLVLPLDGVALVVERAIAEMSQQVVAQTYGQQAIRKRVDFDRYSLLLLQGKSWNGALPLLYWNGHLLAKLSAIDLLAGFRIDYQTFPLLLPQGHRTRGVYRDGWTDGRGAFLDLAYHVPDKASYLRIQTHGYSPYQGDLQQLQLHVRINGSHELPFARYGGDAYYFLLEGAGRDVDSIEVESSTFQPPTADRRRLGLDIAYLQFE